jgi:hypothetical protein
MINDESVEFNSSNVFTALALFNQLTVPLFIFPITIPIIISSLISTRRIERFLAQPELEKEFEGVKHMARVLCKSSESLDDNNEDDSGGGQARDKLSRQDTIDEEEMDEIKINGEPEIDLIALSNYDNQHEAGGGENEAVILRNKSHLRVNLKKQNQLNESTRIERNKLRSTTFVAEKHDVVKRTRLLSFKVPDGVAVCIKEARFSWDNGGKREATSKQLEIDNLSLPLGR